MFEKYEVRASPDHGASFACPSPLSGDLNLRFKLLFKPPSVISSTRVKAVGLLLAQHRSEAVTDADTIHGIDPISKRG